VDPLDLGLLDTKLSYPSLEITPFSDMVMGMLMDVPGLGQDRYSTFDELHLYCYRVAGTVGLMSTPVFGVEKEGEKGMEEVRAIFVLFFRDLLFSQPHEQAKNQRL
jgi:phytoene/squalene synthetase